MNPLSRLTCTIFFAYLYGSVIVLTMRTTSSLPAKYLAFAIMHGGRAPPGLVGAHTNSELIWKRGGIMDTPASCGGERTQKLKKLLLNVNIQNSLGPVRVLLLPENSVRDLIKAAVELYAKEKRRPLLPSTNPGCYELHYSQFSLQSLSEEEKLINLESRNFFLCPKLNDAAKTTCSIDARETTNKSLFPLTKFMDFLL